MGLFKEKHFSDESYIELLNVISANGYKFVRITECTKNASRSGALEKRMMLRHDVDMSPIGALKLGKIENDMGVVANFFFQLNAEPYQMLSPWCVDICRQLQQMGHVVGLHVDSSLFSEEEPKISGTIDWINENLFPMDRAVSFHRPQPKTLGKKYDSFVSAYAEGLFNGNYYTSDSRGEDLFYEKLNRLIENNQPFIQLLLHPCWWENETDRKAIFDKLAARKIRDLKRYLLSNFPKVFGNVIEDEVEE